MGNKLEHIADAQCRNCIYLDAGTQTDVADIRIAKCRNQTGAKIGATAIKDDYVELYSTCDQYVSIFKK
jgi:hypothetical protein